MSRCLQRVLERLDHVQRNGKGLTARCPVHEDRHNSLSISEGKDGRVLLQCFAGCDTESIVKAIGLQMRDLFAARIGRREGGSSIPTGNTATVQQSTGCTLVQYAEAKGLPVDYLHGLGLTDFYYIGQPAIRIPYMGTDGAEAAIRFRLALEKSADGDNRFKWKSGAKPTLYGLWKLEEARKAGYAVAVEGESDCHTLWLHNIPSFGIPGANLWKESWAEYLDDIPIIYVIIEPDRGGDAVRKWLAASRIRERVRLVDLGEHKDPSGLYLADRDHFEENLQAALEASVPWTEVARQEAQEAASALWETCKELARQPDILDLLAADLAENGLVGVTRQAKLVYLVLVSRVTDRPIPAAVKGPSSAGKSYLVERVADFFPANAYHALTGMSEKLLAYDEEPLSHRVLIIYEAAGSRGEYGAYLLRSLLSEGRIRYKTVEKTAQGLKPRTIEREGPTGLITTTVRVSLDAETETRLLEIPIPDDPEQTKAILRAIAREDKQVPDFTIWHALQEWLAGAEHRVTIPFSSQLAEAIPPVAVRLRRDFTTILALIRSHAILHQATRERDAQNRIVATLDDYRVVRDLVADLVAHSTGLTVAKSVAETVATVESLCAETGCTTSLAAVTKELKIDKSAASRRVKQAIDGGWLVNEETGKGKPLKLSVGEPLPAEQELLPRPERLEECCSVDPLQEDIPTSPSPNAATTGSEDMDYEEGFIE